MKQILKLLMIGSLLCALATGGYAAQDHDSGHEQHQSDAADHGDQHGKGEDHDSLDHDEDEHGAGHDGGHDDHGEESVSLSIEQMNFANIKVATLTTRTMDYQVYAPGEVKVNGYTSYIVSPRVDSLVIRRHVALGDHVEKGQALVTLFSETVADAQASFRVADSEWQRVHRLGLKAVGEKRYVSAQTDYEAARGRLLAYGLSEMAIQSIKAKPSSFGEYTLNAVTTGSVLSDDFHQGQHVESGDALMVLADERALWVEARLAPTAQLQLPAGTQAQVKVGKDVYIAQVTQEAHTIDPQTRTRVVRLLVNNDGHRLHPGMFADVYFIFATLQPVLAVPESALMRSSDGDWIVFVEAQVGQFKAQEVEFGRSLGKWREISGIRSGTKVVMEGAFFVASEIAKGSFDPHNH